MSMDFNDATGKQRNTDLIPTNTIAPVASIFAAAMQDPEVGSSAQRTNAPRRSTASSPSSAASSHGENFGPC